MASSSKTFNGSFRGPAFEELKEFHEKDKANCLKYKDIKSRDYCLRPKESNKKHRNPGAHRYGHPEKLADFTAGYVVEQKKSIKSTFDKRVTVHHCFTARHTKKNGEYTKCIRGKHVSYRSVLYNNSMRKCRIWIQDFEEKYRTDKSVDIKGKFSVKTVNEWIMKLEPNYPSCDLVHCEHIEQPCFVIFGPPTKD